MKHENSSSFLAHSNPKVGTTGSGTHWEFYSPRLKRRVVAHSSLEFDFYVSLEMNPDVISWVPQYEVKVTLEGEQRVRVLDAKVSYVGNVVVAYEVKPAEYVNEEGTQRQLRVQEAWATANDARSEVITEARIRANGVLLENSHKMLPWLRPMHEVEPSICRSVLGLLGQLRAPISVQELADQLYLSPGEFVPVLVREYVERRVTMNVENQRFGVRTLVQLKREI